jgi:tRNA(Ile)-lysidine synthetase-like protein
MRYIVAVSGGVDSVVLLDKLVKQGAHELVVAHFDHGIREDSAADARFVSELAKQYGVPFVTKREELGKGASEDMARNRRYAFLRGEAKKRNMRLVTAHHADDVVETIIINLRRGTGWRGLAVLAAADITRPQLSATKQEIYDYALKHRLEWVEDSTNASDVYLRNKIRRLTPLLSPAVKKQLSELRDRQVVLAEEISKETERFTNQSEHSRYFYTQLDAIVACELLRTLVLDAKGVGLTRPQLERALMAVKTARPGSVYQAGEGITLLFTSRSFIVKAS